MGGKIITTITRRFIFYFLILILNSTTVITEDEHWAHHELDVRSSLLRRTKIKSLIVSLK